MSQFRLNIPALLKDLKALDKKPKVETMIKRVEGGIYRTKGKPFLLAHLKAARLHDIVENCEKGKYDE